MLTLWNILKLNECIYDRFKKNDYFFSNKKFSEAELNFEEPTAAAKAAIMASYSLYGINFYQEAEDSLNRFLTTYPGNKNTIYPLK